MQLALEADVNPTALWDAGDLNPRTIGFESIRVSVRMDADAPRQVVEALVAHATLRCRVANRLHNPVHLDIVLM